jgi:hypothetical protein
VLFVIAAGVVVVEAVVVVITAGLDSVQAPHSCTWRLALGTAAPRAREGRRVAASTVERDLECILKMWWFDQSKAKESLDCAVAEVGYGREWIFSLGTWCLRDERINQSYLKSNLY